MKLKASSHSFFVSSGISIFGVANHHTEPAVQRDVRSIGSKRRSSALRPAEDSHPFRCRELQLENALEELMRIQKWSKESNRLRPCVMDWLVHPTLDVRFRLHQRKNFRVV